MSGTRKGARLAAGPGLASMTGYARVTGALPQARFTLEIRSVNGRGLDLRIRLPAGLEALDAEFRRLSGEALSRGSVSIALALERDAVGGELVLDRIALESVLDALAELGKRIEAAPPSLTGILALEGVLAQRRQEPDAAGEQALAEAILSGARDALAQLTAARREEGARIGQVLSERIDEIEALVARAEVHPARSREAIAARLAQQLSGRGPTGRAIGEERLAQEALLLATRADIREELDRLTAHIANARGLLSGGGAVGRKLDFLAQEFNREANTLCAKSNAVELTAIGLDLKAAIDQLREQIQNIE